VLSNIRVADWRGRRRESECLLLRALDRSASTILVGTRQLREIALTDLFPGNGLRFAGIEIFDAFPDLLIPGSKNRFVNFTAEMRDQRFGERLLLLNR
jgi:hypothetical protein